MRLRVLTARNSVMVAALVLAAHTASAQAPAAAPPPPRHFNGDAGLILIYVQPDKTAQFEGAMQKIKEGLQKSEKPERKEQAASWKLFKAGAGAAGQVYAMIMSPSVKNTDYAVGAILAETQPAEARAIFDAYAGSLSPTQGQVVIPLDLVNDFGK
jgi:hypothetical protein